MSTMNGRAHTFPEEAQALLEERGWSLRQLARATQAEHGWGSLSTIHEILAGQRRATMAAMENIASAMRVDPRDFLEYRLAMARHNLNPEAVGIEAATDYATRLGILKDE